MILNLILDTNTWIYLSTGFDVKKNRIEKDKNLHFDLLEKLLEKINIHDCQIYTNYIIIKEWDENKEATKVVINKSSISINK